MWNGILARLRQSRVRTSFDKLTFQWEGVKALRTEIDQLRSRIDLGPGAPERFWKDRQSPEYQAVYEKSEPLVSVCIATYNRAELVTERAVRSVLAQTYRNIQLIVVGDHCTDDTERRLSQIRDSRLQFVNLPERGKYPEDPQLRWMVAGTAPVNHALGLSEGEFVTHLDDDDEHLPERTALLVEHIQRGRFDIIWHPFWFELRPDAWRMNQASEFGFRSVSTSSVLYHRWFRQIPWDPMAYTYGEPGDWNRFRKFRYLGAKSERNPTALLRHYRERSQRSA